MTNKSKRQLHKNLAVKKICETLGIEKPPSTGASMLLTRSNVKPETCGVGRRPSMFISPNPRSSSGSKA